MQRKQFLRLAGFTLGGWALAPVLTACGGGDEGAIDASAPELDRTAEQPLQGDGLSAEEIAGLMFMREEEKLAHDVYVALHDLWGAQVFVNIVPSEAQHTEAIRRLILVHGLADPAATTPAGVFVNADLQRLYDELVALGQTSLIEALKVGCLIEEKDIVDIEDTKRQVLGEPDVVAVYDNLLCGSRNHLRAFNRALEVAGGVYDQPQFLSVDEWTAIAGSAPEPCGA